MTKDTVVGEITKGEAKQLIMSFAVMFAAAAHHDQRRKYTNEPYVQHCIEVGALILAFSEYDERITNEVIVAAVLHDVLEDTPIKAEVLSETFDPRVTKLVLEVTDVSKPEDGNREQRKAIDRAHLAKASYEGATIKYADLINNTGSISDHDPKFAKVYLQEKRELLKVMRQGNQNLLKLAEETLEKAEAKLSHN